MRKRHYRFTVLFDPAEEGGYIVSVPALPAVHTQGENLAEARAMAQDAIRTYIEYLMEKGLPIPEDTELALDPVKEKVAVTIPAA